MTRGSSKEQSELRTRFIFKLNIQELSNNSFDTF